MSKQVLSIEQMKFLKELGVDTSKASMCHVKFDGESEFSNLLPNNQELFERLLVVKYIPAFTLQDILDLLPKEIECEEETIPYHLEIAFDGEVWDVSYTRNFYTLQYIFDDSFIDAAYKMLCWCIENGYVGKEEHGHLTWI